MSDPILWWTNATRSSLETLRQVRRWAPLLNSVPDDVVLTAIARASSDTIALYDTEEQNLAAFALQVERRVRVPN